MKSFSDYFKKVHNGDETKAYYSLELEAPQALWALYRAACDVSCGGGFASETILEAIEELEENGNDIDRVTIEPDCYYRALDKWFCECEGAACLCDEAVEEGLADGKEIYKTIAAGQYLAKDRIYRLVHEFLEENKVEVEA